MGGGDVVILKDLISRTFNYVKKRATSKFSLDVFGEMVGAEGALFAIQSLSTIKKGTSHSNLKTLIECVWGNGGRERGVNYSPLTFDY